MNILIADSGSTKTDWVLLKGTEVVAMVQTAGLNPYFQTSEEISNELDTFLKPALEKYSVNPGVIHYYGTGCSTAENCRLMEQSLHDSLLVKNIHISHDLLAAARALCNREWGIASILGTGSNSCLYNGETILENVPSTGYLWSDYGGGSQIGKYLIKEYFEETMPPDLKDAFEKEGYNREEILKNVYKSNIPGRYLASVSLFAAEHAQHPFVLEVLENCFDSFFIQQVNKYSDAKNYKVHTVGSVGFYFKELIAAVAEKHGYKMGNVIKSPIEGLIKYHTNQ